MPDRFIGHSVVSTLPVGEQQPSHRRPDGVTLCIPGSSITAMGEQPLTPQEAARLLDEVLYAAPDLSWVGGR